MPALFPTARAGPCGEGARGAFSGVRPGGPSGVQLPYQDGARTTHGPALLPFDEDAVDAPDEEQPRGHVDLLPRPRPGQPQPGVGTAQLEPPGRGAVHLVRRGCGRRGAAKIARRAPPAVAPGALVVREPRPGPQAGDAPGRQVAPGPPAGGERPGEDDRHDVDVPVLVPAV